MRLINTRTGLFEEYIGRDIPPYAILSHTWGQEEVSFRDMSDPSCCAKKGYEKITMTCRLASEAGLDYAWIDTCCIDKSSSAELTEAINSMYRWYQRSSVCYAYLIDFEESCPLETALPNCRWFTRGWTLQELIAPEDVIFLDRGWHQRGSKTHLLDEISRITRIHRGVLQQTRHLSSVSVAQKMSWAAHRQTTRIEDSAYCLLGIFDVNIPLMYGEEEKAFRRLQEEIVRTTPDLSIFAWRLPPATKDVETCNRRVFCGLLAESTLAFRESGEFIKKPSGSRREFSVSNCGIKTHFQTFTQLFTSGRWSGRYVLPLDCSLGPSLSLGVWLKKCGPDQFLRENPWSLLEYRGNGNLFPNPPVQRYLLTDISEVALRPDPRHFDSRVLVAQTRSHILQIDALPGIHIYETWSRARWDDEDGAFFVSGNSGQDSSALRLVVTCNVRIDGQDQQEVRFKAIFFAVGWSRLDKEGPQCTMVDYEDNPMLDEAFSRIQTWDNDTSQVLEELIRSGIPKTRSAAFNVAGTDVYIIVSFTLTLVNDPDICESQFWKVDIYYHDCKAGDLPSVEYEQWIMNYAWI